MNGEAAAYDGARGKVVTVNGRIGGGYFVGTLGFDGSRWETLTTTGPKWREGASMAYDSRRRVLVYFGGSDNQFFIGGDTWEFAGPEPP